MDFPPDSTGQSAQVGKSKQNPLEHGGKVNRIEVLYMFIIGGGVPTLPGRKRGASYPRYGRVS